MVPTTHHRGRKTGYGDRAEYSIQNWGASPFGFLEIEGRVSPSIRILDANRSELGLFRERNAVYSFVRTLLRGTLPNFYICKGQGRSVATASEIYNPLVCRVKLQIDETAHKRMEEFAICCGVWIACTPSF
jgi:hypothetical protein